MQGAQHSVKSSASTATNPASPGSQRSTALLLLEQKARYACTKTTAPTSGIVPMRSPVLIFRPLRSWTISSVRPGHSPALSMPIFPANPGALGAVCHVGASRVPHSGHSSVLLKEKVLACQRRTRGREEDAGRDEGHYPFPTRGLLSPPPPGRRFRVPRLERLLWARPAAPSADHEGKRASHLQAAELHWVLVTANIHAQRQRHRHTYCLSF